MIACKFSATKSLKKILDIESSKIYIDAVDTNSRTALHFACDGGHFLKSETERNLKELKRIKEKKLEIVKDLIEKGANIEAKDQDGLSALHWASEYGHLEIVKHLLEKGANPGAKDKEGLSPLQKSRNEEICTLLKESTRGEDSNLRSLKRKFD